MSQQGKTLGTDVTLKIVGPNGKLDFLVNITSFSKSQLVDQDTRKYIDAPNAYLNFYQGWQGTFEIDRTGPGLIDFFMNQEAIFNRGEDLLTLTITETIKEPDGTISQYLYTGVTLRLTNAGSYNKDSVVAQTIEFMASRGQKIT